MVMKLYIIEDYREVYPDIKGRELTERLIKEILGDIGVENAEIKRTGSGKPYVDAEDVFFSVSHSGNYFVMLTDNLPVGVDIQKETGADTETVSRRYFTEEEAELVRSEGREIFFKLWTMKEAYAKYLGTGLGKVLGKVSVLNREDVEFAGFQLEKGMYCTCCMKKQK